MAMWFLRIFMLLLVSSCVSSDFLENPDFESPPLNLPKNLNASSVSLDQNSTLPGWTFQGTVLYVTSLELPDTGHAVQLGEDGKINQTFIAKGDDLNYILTFALIRGGQNCSSSAGLSVSGPDSNAVFSYRDNISKVSWQSYSHNLGRWGNGEPINLVLESQAIDSDTNSTCWPIIDTLLIKTIGVTLVQESGNLLTNGGFESGPGFLPNSTEGVLIEEVPSLIQSALRQWSVIGTVRYIDSEHFHVPEGKAAIEILADKAPSGIQTATRDTSEGSRYNLTFTLGDANDACRGHFVVGVQAGSTAQNFTLESNGTGSGEKFGLVFEADKAAAQISFTSYSVTMTKEDVLCGPVIDEVIVHPPLGGATSVKPTWLLLICVFLYVAVL
ncbi:BIIDXI-like protein [Cardamine amara subsp. amara]|uniref:BIIDXI-like protein n=1 Tax=Cardamine amara subsp. amara TaxID=228776 RepID=A0ABD1B4P6_CARAN